MDPEELDNFGKAWSDAVFLCIERRMMAEGDSVDEVLRELVEELGLDKIREIIEHFLGMLTVESIEDEENPVEDNEDENNFSE